VSRKLNHYLSEAAARSKAQKVLKSLYKPSKWKVRVWENLGWHWSLVSPPVALHYSPADGKFFVLMSDSKDHAGGGLPLWTDHRDYSDPNRAIQSTVRKAEVEVNRLREVLSQAVKVAFKLTRRSGQSEKITFKLAGCNNWRDVR
jgi:hypothetical protein